MAKVGGGGGGGGEMENLRMAEIFYRRTYLLLLLLDGGDEAKQGDRQPARLNAVVCTCLLLAPHEPGSARPGPRVLQSCGNLCSRGWRFLLPPFVAYTLDVFLFATKPDGCASAQPCIE